MYLDDALGRFRLSLKIPCHWGVVVGESGRETDRSVCLIALTISPPISPKYFPFLSLFSLLLS